MTCAEDQVRVVVWEGSTERNRKFMVGWICVMIESCPLCLSVRPVKYCYHDIFWTAWTVLIKLSENIH